MKKFRRIKVIKGNEYFYEITPYYDPKSKKIRHKSKYLGKNIDGKPVKVRENLPRNCYNYGDILLFESLIDELNIREILSKHLNKDDLKSVEAIVLNRAIYPLALKHIKSWYEGTYLYQKDKSVRLSSQRLSRLLSKIGESSIPDYLSKRLIEDLGSKRSLLYDITSLSSYSKKIGLLEYGYNRDGDNLPQVNLSLVVDRESGIPIMYDLYPGSIVDVSTLMNTIKRLESYGIEDSLVVLDRGFFSKGNLSELVNSKLSFIIPASFTLKEIKRTLNSVQKQFEDLNNLKKYNGDPIFVVSKIFQIEDNRLSCYCYYSPKREKEEQEIFYRRLYDIKETMESLNLHANQERFKELAGHYYKYFDIQSFSDGITVKIKRNAVAQRVNRMGRFMIVYRGELTWEDCLRMYRSKDLVEKGFEIIKNDLELNTPGVSRESTLRGLLFICFLGLILRMRLLKKLQNTGLHKRYSLTALILELSKIKKVELSNHEMITTNITKKQKEIINKLNLCA